MASLRRAAGAWMLLAAVGCGPSFGVVAEEDGQWDRCAGLDRDDQSSNDDRLACWRGWDQTYSQGQPPERVRTARRRISELTRPPVRSSGGQRAVAPPPVPLQDPQGNPLQDPNAPPGWGTPPGPPPPSTVGPSVAPPPGPSIAPSRPSGPQPPGAACETGCRDAWNSCAVGCNGDAACSARCDDAYRDCMRGCF